MAKSLVCNDCGLLLRSIKDAQDHNDATGHANFEETTTAIQSLRCSACGKVCRTDAERDMHTRMNPGHDAYADVTDQAGTLDSEQQMKAARAELRNTPMAEAGPSGGADEELVPAEVEPSLLQALLDMEFPLNRATRALAGSGNSSVEGAVNWLADHEADADLDEPLLVKKSANRPKLSPEEARAKAEELIRVARERREKEERDDAQAREKARIRAGKELALAKRAEEDLALKRNLEFRQREKAEAERAREAIRARLEEDRRERRRKLGLPEEATEEEKAKEAAKKAEAAAAEEAKKAARFVARPASMGDKLRGQLTSMKKAHPGAEDAFKVAAATLLRYLANIVGAPDEEKFRSIKLGNAAFQQRVAAISGSLEFLEMLGFVRGPEALTLPREAVSVELLTAAGNELNNAISNPFFGVL